MPPPPVSATSQRRFLVALSFPGEKREFVRRVAEILAASIGKGRIFYDAWYKSELAQPDLDLILGDIYGKCSELIVPFLSQDYGTRSWCGLEWRQMRDVLQSGEGSRIMQFRFDREPIPGTLGIDGFVEIHPDIPENRNHPELTVTPEDVAALILNRISAHRPLRSIEAESLPKHDCKGLERSRSARTRDPVLVCCGHSIRQNSKTMSILAIIETLAASATAMYAAFAWGATIWFAAYIFVAPLLLLKTKGSVRRGLKYGHALVRAIAPVIIWTWSQVEGSKSRIGSLFFNIVHLIACGVFFTILTMFSPIVKLAATLIEWHRNWLLPLRRLPKNWSSICLQTDLTILPELLPGSSHLANTRWAQSTPKRDDSERSKPDDSKFKKGGFPEFLRTQHQNGLMFSLQALRIGLWRSSKSKLEYFWSLILMLPAMLGIVFFGLAYRWALKATALFWAPLLFFTQAIFRKNDTLQWRVDEVIEIPYGRVQRVWSLIIVFMHFVIPILCWHCFIEFTQNWINAMPQMAHILRYLLVTNAPEATSAPDLSWHATLKSWHITALLGAGITWMMWKLAHDYRVALREKRYSHEKERIALKTMQLCLFTRASCMTWSLFCLNVAIFKTFHDWFHMPHIILFP